MRTRMSIVSAKRKHSHASFLIPRSLSFGMNFRNNRSRGIHQSQRSLGSGSPAAEAAAESPAASSSSSSSSPSPAPGDGETPASDTPPNGSDKGNDSSKDSSSSSSSSSNQTATTGSTSKRRLKIQRGPGKSTLRTSLTADSAGTVYVPVIPESFIATHYHSETWNNYDISTIPYHVHGSVLNEILNSMASSLVSPNDLLPHLQRMPARQNNLIISSPSEGSSKMLETITMAAAKKLGADVIVVDMQDLMELTPDIFNTKGVGNPWPADDMARGFNPFITAPVPDEFMDAIAGDSDDDDSDDDSDDDTDTRSVQLKAFRKAQAQSISPVDSMKERFEKFWTALILAGSPSTTSSRTSRSQAREKSQPKVLYLKDIADIILTPLGSVLIPSLSNAVLTLRRAGHNIMAVAGHSPSLLALNNDEDDDISGELKNKSGSTSADAEPTKDMPLITILQKLRSPSEHGHHHSHLQYGHISLASMTYDTFPGPTQSFHHISIPPFLPPAAVPSGSHEAPDHAQKLAMALEYSQKLKQDKADKIKEVNCRNLYSVLQFRGGFISEHESPLTIFGTLRGADNHVWGFGKVFRIISNALGSLKLSQLDRKGDSGANDVLLQQHVQYAMDVYTENAILRKKISSDMVGKKEQKKESLIVLEDCSRYERKLIGSIVDPDKIKTTFKNTIIPAETIHTLQTMITLPLVRPQLFSKGLLRDEFLSGLLLFGPPGTGKTLLAKAVAKESGARMLEIKASDIFDMYVGEGEKNVSAVFSLARKLSPCVIFLDEVDSIFRARGSIGAGGSGGGNSSQREILNQFMVEWDGLRSSGQNQGIVVMASTNRPFELDDAVLRRLPRRILVDLPSEEAREQILNVYLGQEQLEGVDIKDLAKKTALYSGSDLKNLCVSATLAAVREDVENEVRGLQSTGGDGSSNEKDNKILDLSPLLDQYKTKAMNPDTTKGFASSNEEEVTPSRVIRKRHLEKALAQITPSCSENMDSLTELRKWDGLYGDGGKGRRKGIKGIGFQVDLSSTKDKAKKD
ncbi:hypothetical protein BGZ76_001271 [Entomortierella beljakovae]|nr:hypothetical protein BGZ76_001271 [Entomortierella beljakovae]